MGADFYQDGIPKHCKKETLENIWQKYLLTEQYLLTDEAHVV